MDREDRVEKGREKPKQFVELQKREGKTKERRRRQYKERKTRETGKTGETKGRQNGEKGRQERERGGAREREQWRWRPFVGGAPRPAQGGVCTERAIDQERGPVRESASEHGPARQATHRR